jgi:hypothetical protein
MKPRVIGRLARVDGVMLGFVLGVAFGLWNLVFTLWKPLLDPMFAIWVSQAIERLAAPDDSWTASGWEPRSHLSRLLSSLSQ